MLHDEYGKEVPHMKQKYCDKKTVLMNEKCGILAPQNTE